MSGNVKTQIGKVIGKTLNSYYPRVKSTIDDLKYKQEYQDRIIECMVGEVDDNYITTPETDNPVVKLEHSKEGLVKLPTVKGKTILVDADGNETDTPAEGCKLLSVGEQEDNKLIILSKNKNLFDGEFEKGFIGSNGLNVETSSGFYWRTKNYIVFNGSLNLSLKQKGLFSGFIAFFYDLEDNLILETRKLYNPSMFNTLDIPQGANKLRIYFELNSGVNDLSTIFEDMQIEYGTQSTSYVEPKQHKTEILLNEPLRKYDYMLDNKIYRKCKNMQIEPNFKIYPQQIWNDYYGVYMEINGDFSEIAPSRISGVTVYYSRFIINYNRWDIVSDYGRQAMNMYMLSTDLSKHLQLFCKIPKNEVELYTGNIDEKVQQWFNDNAPRLDIVYEIAEPIIEELPNSITTQGFDDTTMYIENSITPTITYGYNALIPYKQELSQQKEEVEVNTLDIENNIIPYLMDMEFNLIMMEDEE